MNILYPWHCIQPIAMHLMMIMRKMPRRQNAGTPSQFREMTRTTASLHFSTHVPGLYISYFSTGAFDYARLQILLFCTILISTILHLFTLTRTQVSTLLGCANYIQYIPFTYLPFTCNNFYQICTFFYN